MPLERRARRKDLSDQVSTALNFRLRVDEGSRSGRDKRSAQLQEILESARAMGLIGSSSGDLRKARPEERSSRISPSTLASLTWC